MAEILHVDIARRLEDVVQLLTEQRANPGFGRTIAPRRRDAGWGMFGIRVKIGHSHNRPER